MTLNKNLYKRFVLSVILILFLLSVLIFNPSNYAYADTKDEVYDLDSSNVLDDLKSSYVDGEAFDINHYPKNPNGKLEVISFVEYCYGFDVEKNDDYALYVYIYNPALTSYDLSHFMNRIKMAVSLNSMGYVSEYDYFNIKFLSKSDDGLFLKFKIYDANNVLLNCVSSYAQEHSGDRPYYIGSIELVEDGKTNATSYSVGKNYKYSGFAKGYGDYENFPLEMTCEGIDVLSTTVHYTWWRPNGESSIGSKTQQQLNSVYFMVPNWMIEKYGRLTAVHMSWYEYLTKPIFITGNSTIYNHLIDYIGDTFNSYSEEAKYGFAVNKVEAGPNDQYALADYVYNAPGIVLNPINNGVALDTLYYLFQSNKSNVMDYVLSADDLLNYIQTYDGSGEKINGKYYSELFESYVDEGRTFGYNDINVKADDEMSLTGYTLTQSWWQKLLGTGDYVYEEFSNIKGIEEVSVDDIHLDNNAFSSKYFVNIDDVPALKSFVEDVDAQNSSTVFLLRYAVTSYESKTATEVQGTKSLGVWFSKEIDDNAYMMRQTLFLDLTIIDVTFTKDEEDTIIPVSANPIDGVSDSTPPVNESEDPTDYFKQLIESLLEKFKSIIGIILGVLFGILFLYIAGPILPWLFKGIIWVITLPFRVIKTIITSLKKR